MTERRDVSLLLQFEAHLIDAARGIDCKHQREIDRLAAAALRGGGTDGGKREDKGEKNRERAPDCLLPCRPRRAGAHVAGLLRRDPVHRDAGVGAVDRLHGAVDRVPQARDFGGAG